MVKQTGKTYLIQQIKVTKVNVETAIVGSIYPQICSQLSELIFNIIVYEVSQESRARHSISVVKVTGRCT